MHSVMEIEEKIRQRYCQPTGVEQFGIEPVPPKLKTVRWHDIFAIIFGLALNPGSMLVGGRVWSAACHFGAIGAITAGILLATIAYTITATVVVDYRLPGQVFDAHGSMACAVPNGHDGAARWSYGDLRAAGNRLRRGRGDRQVGSTAG